MAWHDHDSWLTQAFAPNPTTIGITLLLVLVLPILLHFYIHRNATPTSLPNFLLVGPSGSGKTAFLTLVSHPPFPFYTSYSYYTSNTHHYGL